MRKSTYILPVFFFVLILSYQNCSQELGTLGGETNKKSDGIPFPYELNIDTIAYMSCKISQASNLGQGTYFTFRAMATNSSSSGIQLSSEFKNFVNAKGGTYEDYKANLERSEKIKNLRLQFSLKDPLDVLYVNNRYMGAFPHISFTDPYLFTSFASNQNLNYPLQSSAKVDLDLRAQVLPEELFENVNDVVLTLDFSKTTDPANSIGPATFGESSDLKKLYGKKYRMRFIDQGNSDNAYVSSLVEYYGHNDQYKMEWSCPKYKIIKHGASHHGCGANVQDITHHSHPKLYKVLGSGWKYISGGGDHCIQPTTNVGGCYYENAGNFAVEYHYASIMSGDCTDDGANNSKICANYLSLCTKSL